MSLFDSFEKYCVTCKLLKVCLFQKNLFFLMLEFSIDRFWRGQKDVLSRSCFSHFVP